MHIYISNTCCFLEFSRRTAWGKDCILANSVCHKCLWVFPITFSLRRLYGAKLQVFAIPMAANWGSWDDSLVFIKPHFGALSAVLAPFFAWWYSVCTFICVTVTFACLLCLAYSIWGQDAGTTAFSVWGFTNYRSILFTCYVFFLVSVPCLLLGDGGVLIRVEMSCG